ncbi:ABC-type putative dipeptide/oligopeptide transporter, permease subunit [Corynebacterium glutamicum MB001]|uniref:ABC-type transporter, permease components n=1 Tax=Corynebacterium glutamicum (strain ATCC 13032 / DSM 20300 / JCM 1318 / BCRC 11384 / CCUG 27702 / LMG 3730 / NBRC 12168 / NCIMB 10025 / NRRL B-2784 / 534) TaxID=196627 RepID=Q8NN85_CORGL|nr:ABC transporter permease [Corynebacterium glutamicum]AGT06050.1 ABC-type putative dipeptide/oligopeptide transporter, permease subunit [Corynebacterium glutamicum MB001]ARV63649.1 ABC transporter permease [Corynebacterium glutamicum]ASW14690.1 ABC-type putative dipeptide/oligopeptide transporter, permease subunit [Corynebacterium glutamicum]AUI01755.1 ABC transporter permease [Corynebacterium glutamicum]AUI05427.1 ABC transporter permease [Corynebacterium glutamicum]
MSKTIAWTVLRYTLTFVIASIIIFVLIRVIPGDPAAVALGITATPEAIAALQSQLGTDQPLFQQYFSWIGGMLTGDFGTSLSSGQDLSPIIFDRLQVSLILVGCSIVLSLLIAIPLGVLSARRGGVIISGISQIGIAIPSFLAGILLVAVFAVGLGWLPANGWIPPSENFGGFLARLILPVLALTAVQAAILTRYVRSAVMDVMGQDFMRTARSKGMSFNRALIIHGLRNAALPVLTVTGLQLTTLVIGAVVIEQVFVIPGIGSMLLESVSNRDLIAVQSIVMLLVAFTLLVNLVVDLLYQVVDPRVGAVGVASTKVPGSVA